MDNGGHALIVFGNETKIRLNSLFWLHMHIFKSDEFKFTEQQEDDDEQPDECVGNQNDTDTFEINVSVRQVTTNKK